MSQRQVVEQVLANCELVVAGEPTLPKFKALSEEQRKGIYEEVTSRLIDEGKIKADKYDTREKVRAYVPGMVNNWLNKAKSLNGGVTHAYKNPGSRPQDEQLKEMNKLMKQYRADPVKNADKIEIIADAIAKRKAAVAASKEKPTTINIGVLPTDLLESLDLDEEQQA